MSSSEICPEKQSLDENVSELCTETPIGDSSKEICTMSSSDTGTSGENRQESNESQISHRTTNSSDSPVENSASQQRNASPEQQRMTFMDRIKGTAFRMLMVYCILNVFRKYTAPRNGTTTSPQFSGGNPLLGHNMFSRGALLDMYAYISEEENYKTFSESELFWFLPNISYGCWTCGPKNNGEFMKSDLLPISDNVKNNGSLYLHVYFVEPDKSPNPASGKAYNKRTTFFTSKQMNVYRRKTYKKTKNLITGETEHDEDYQKKAADRTIEIISYWHPNLTINLIDDQTLWTPNRLQSPLDQYVHFDSLTGMYYPIIYLNDYWNLYADYKPINQSVQALEVSLTYSPIQFWKWQIYLAQQMQKSWYGNFFGDAEEQSADQDAVKQALLETSPYLLALTFIVSILHTVFEFLAFKNDIQFWRNRTNLEGLSVRSLFFSIFMNVIVVLYVLDNDTNTMVKICVCLGLFIEMWKIPKVISIQVDRSRKLFGPIPYFKLSFKSSYVQSSTSEYDKTAFKYLSFAFFPLVLAYAIYSLIYHEHRGWYSWVLSMIYGFMLTFGFIMMTPQLFINYKMKSVAHLPWRMMTYKALNTFIDDIFAFIIKAPTLYRIGCFRDDIIFFIYLYQRWIYGVDLKRVNEFGVSGEELLRDSHVSNANESDHVKSE